mgnify:CR=1 FL=1
METLEYIIRVIMVVVPVLGLSVMLMAAPYFFIVREEQLKKEAEAMKEKSKKDLNKDESIASN